VPTFQNESNGARFLAGAESDVPSPDLVAFNPLRLHSTRPTSTCLQLLTIRLSLYAQLRWGRGFPHGQHVLRGAADGLRRGMRQGWLLLRGKRRRRLFSVNCCSLIVVARLPVVPHRINVRVILFCPLLQQGAGFSPSSADSQASASLDYEKKCLARAPPLAVAPGSKGILVTEILRTVMACINTA
jgi:hypothetical protein